MISIAGRRGLARQCAYLFAMLSAFFFFLPGPSAHARSLPAEFGMFLSLCAVVDFEPYPLASEVEEATKIEGLLAAHVRQKFAARGLTYPIEQGVQCYPRKVATDGRQLAVVFHVTLKQDPANDPRTLVAVILHVQFEAFPQAAHVYPTELFVCGDRRDLSSCLLPKLIEYFDGRVFPQVETGEQHRERKR